ncbi:MAG: hypothetical protein EOO07_05295 [Chitinophagaceae bacterium]|nr:MAG: hypothetical protein EOO07_05295 [Chitinophagaceae bacterium]
METNKQYIVTMFTLIVISLLTYFLWQFGKAAEYPGFRMVFDLIFGFLLAFVGGILALVQWPFRHLKNTFVSIYNSIGTFNIYFSIVAGMSAYYNSGNKLTIAHVLSLITFCMGLVILQGIYLGRHKGIK